jgi:hypothetical protein
MENKKVVVIDADSILYAVCFKNKDSDNFKDYKDHIDTWITNIINKCKGTHYIMALTMGKVFRHNLAITKEYKSGRGAKPKFFMDLRNHLLDTWNAVWQDEFEAEDLVSIYVAQNPNTDYVIAHIDHDLKSLPNLHYDFRTDKFYTVTPEEGNYYFWKSMFTGCQTDKICGLPGVGDKKAEKLLNGVETGRLREVVMEEYIKYYGEYMGIIKFTESYRLLRLLDDEKHVLGEGSWTGLKNPLEPIPFIPKQVTYNFNINDFIQ